MAEVNGAKASNATSLAAAFPPEGIGGAGRPGSRPLASDLIAWGAMNALLGHLRRPPGAWIGLSTSLARLGEVTFAASGLPASTLRRGKPSLPPQPSLRLSRERWRSNGLFAS